uniref:Uncharacterized protein n=1 Tax=viral metagenome TaxID=1070528 RepID=A0A6M3INS2_9ZZZZ
MAKTVYIKTGLTGGTSTDLDGIDGSDLLDGDFCFVHITNNLCYFYLLDSDSGAAESSPTVISPDLNAGTKRWILLAGKFTTIDVTGAITSTLADGTAPFTIASTTKVMNLNVDQLDGADWASPLAIGGTIPAAITGTSLSGTSLDVQDGAITNVGDIALDSISSDDTTKPFILNATTLVSDGVLIGNKTAIGTWAGDGVSSAGTANITDVGGAAHGLSLAVGDLVHISAATTASHKGFYRVVSDDGTTVAVDRTLAATDTDLTVTFYKDVIGVFATDGINGQRITGYSHRDKPLQIGGDVLAATGHSLGGEDVLIGGQLEVNGASFFDTLATFGDTSINPENGVVALAGGQTHTIGTFTMAFTSSYAGLLITENTTKAIVFGGIAQNYDHGNQTNPTIFLHSILNPNTSNNQWGSFSHNQEDFLITTGVNVGTGTAPTTDENGIKLFPRTGAAGLHVKGLGELHATRAAITVGSGAGITVNVTGDLNRQLYKVTTTYAAYTDADTTKGIVIATLPAKMKIVGFYADTTAAYTGGATNAATMVVGITAESAAEIIASHNVFAGAILAGDADTEMGTSMTRAAAIQGGYMPSWTGTTAIYATLVIVNDILSNLTAGSTTFYIETEQF